MIANTLKLSIKSERVLRLTAQCIQTAVRLRLGVPISYEQALDLSRVHDVGEAVESFRVKMQVHQQVPEAARINLAASEATVTDMVAGHESIEHILMIRHATFENAGIVNRPPVSQAISRDLDLIRLDASHWASRYGQFTDDLFALYRDAARQLSRALPIEERVQAMVELELIVRNALRRA